MGCLLLFLTFSVVVAYPKKLLYTVANPARGLLNREKRTREKLWRVVTHFNLFRQTTTVQRI